MHKFVATFFIGCALAFSVEAGNGVALRQIPNAQKVGEGRLSIVFWDVYDATLYATGGTWDAQKPHALSIHYFRDIKGVDIADRSTDEMRKQGFSDEQKLASWQKRMREIFPNVAKGSVLTAVYTAQKNTDFYAGEKKIGSIKEAEFGEQFFAIWLSEKTSEPGLRRKLLGLS